MVEVKSLKDRGRKERWRKEGKTVNEQIEQHGKDRGAHLAAAEWHVHLLAQSRAVQCSNIQR